MHYVSIIKPAYKLDLVRVAILQNCMHYAHTGMHSGGMVLPGNTQPQPHSNDHCSHKWLTMHKEGIQSVCVSVTVR